MYLCLCNAVTMNTVEKLVENGCKNMEEIMQTCKAGNDCGACKIKMQKMINKSPLSNVQSRGGNGETNLR